MALLWKLQWPQPAVVAVLPPPPPKLLLQPPLADASDSPVRTCESSDTVPPIKCPLFRAGQTLAGLATQLQHDRHQLR